MITQEANLTTEPTELPDVSDRDSSAATPTNQPPRPWSNGAAAAPKVKKRKRQLPPATFLLAGLFGAGIVFLYLLSLNVGPKIASEEEKTVEAKVDAALLQLGAASSQQGQDSETAALINTFYYEAKQRQIPLEQLASNPFIYQPPGLHLEGKTLVDPTQANTTTSNQKIRKEEMLQAARSLKLQSVLMSEKSPKALISNNLVTEGQTINGWMVKSIDTRQVELIWKDETYVVTMPR